MFNSLRKLFSSNAPAQTRRQHLAFQDWPAAIYAVGDVHGCLAEMQALERQIIQDASTIVGEKWIVYLGDYVDRGPDSAGVLDVLVARPPAGFQRLYVVGNHEVMALSFLKNPQPGADWLSFGGLETLYSYGLSPGELQAQSPRSRQATLASHIPNEHIALLEEMPLTISVPGVLFVHAGIRPGVETVDQREEDLLWIRDAFFDAPPTQGLRVVHGHTPDKAPVITDGRICLDTGAFATGILTAARLTPDGAVKILQTAAR